MKTLLSEEKEKVIEGMDLLADVVGSTMGPGGSHVLIQSVVPLQEGRNPDGRVRPTKDGATVAAHIVDTNNYLQMYGVKLARACAESVRKNVGDGTSTATVLAAAAARACCGAGISSRAFIDGMKAAVDDAIAAIKDSTLKVDSLEALMKVARVSANEHPLAEVVGKLVWSLGPDGVLYQSPSMTAETRTEKFEGYVAPWGIDPTFFTPTKDGVMNCTNVGDAYVAITDYHISDAVSSLDPIVSAWLKVAVSPEDNTIKPLVILCSDIDGTAMKTLLSSRGRFKFDAQRSKISLTPAQVRLLESTSFLPIFPVKVPESQQKKDFLRDLAALLGGKVVASWETGVGLRDFRSSHLCQAKVFYANKQKCIFTAHEVGEEVKQRIDMLKEQNEREPSQLLQERIAAMSSGTGVIYIGGDTREESETNQDVVDDVQTACFSAMRHGAIPGSGAVLADFAMTFSLPDKDDDFRKGYSAMATSMAMPHFRILTNAGMKPLPPESRTSSIDANTGKVVDLVEAGILDPAMAAIESLKAALATAVALVGTKHIITNES